MAILPPEKYDPAKVEKIREYLQFYSQQGNPVDFEILVDGFKVVRRTNNPDLFSMHESFVGGDTKAIEILLFTGTSNNNDKRIFILKDESKKEEQGLSGIEIDNRILEHVNKAKQEWDYDRLKEENKELKEEIEELEEEVEKLEKEKADMLAGQSPLKGLLGEVGSSFLESLVRRNPKMLLSLPGGEALAGIVEEDNRRRVTDTRQLKVPANDTEVTFSSSEENTLSEEDRSAIQFMNQLKSSFTSEEFDKILVILQSLAIDKKKIDFLINQLNIQS